MTFSFSGEHKKSTVRQSENRDKLRKAEKRRNKTKVGLRILMILQNGALSTPNTTEDCQRPIEWNFVNNL